MNHTKAVIYGIAIWAVVFIVSMMAFPFRESERPLFESIMPVALSMSTVIASVYYFKTIKERHVPIAWCLGLIWLVVSLVIDAALFSWGPMKMSLADYVKDIGLTYLVIPAIVVGFGYALRNKA